MDIYLVCVLFVVSVYFSARMIFYYQLNGVIKTLTSLYNLHGAKGKWS